MKRLRIKDNSRLAKSDFDVIRHLTARIADKTAETLSREGIFVFPPRAEDSADLDVSEKILESEGDTYRTGNVMGFLGLGDERLTIASRFDGEDDFFLRYLLENVMAFPNAADFKIDANPEERLFQFLLFLFPSYLKAAMRKGVYKEYIRREYNDTHVNGVIDVARHIAKNTPFIGNVAYGRREFSYDNGLTQLVRHTVEFIKGKPYGHMLLSKVKEETKLIVRATPTYAPGERRKIAELNEKNIVRHAYFREYGVLQRLCLLILRHRKHQIGGGEKRIYGILFDGAWLWEEYVATLVGNRFHHPRNKAKEGGQRLFAGNKGLIYPDFIGRDAAARAMADAKYKPPGNIGNKDYLQMLAYMFRFEAKTGYFFYPETARAEDEILLLNRGTTYEGNAAPRGDIRIIKHGFAIPAEAEDYETFRLKMKEAEESFRNGISK